MPIPFNIALALDTLGLVFSDDGALWLKWLASMRSNVARATVNIAQCVEPSGTCLLHWALDRKHPSSLIDTVFIARVRFN